MAMQLANMQPSLARLFVYNGFFKSFIAPMQQCHGRKPMNAILGGVPFLMSGNRYVLRGTLSVSRLVSSTPPARLVGVRRGPAPLRPHGFSSLLMEGPGIDKQSYDLLVVCLRGKITGGCAVAAVHINRCTDVGPLGEEQDHNLSVAFN